MLKFITENFKWMCDGNGTFLCVRSPQAETVKFCESIKDKPRKWQIEVKEYNAKRTLTANAYYWVLLNKIAEKLGYSNAYTHNQMLRRYAPCEQIDGQNVFITVPATEEAENQVDEMEHSHFLPTANLRIGKDGNVYRTYVMLKGSSQMDKKEMARLIDGTVGEAKELDIETLTPAQLSALRYE